MALSFGKSPKIMSINISFSLNSKLGLCFCLFIICFHLLVIFLRCFYCLLPEVISHLKDSIDHGKGDFTVSYVSSLLILQCIPSIGSLMMSILGNSQNIELLILCGELLN